MGSHLLLLFRTQVATIAESAYSSVLGPKNSVSVDLDTTNNIWQMTVGYSEGFAAPWLKGLTALVVILSVAISLLLMTILVAKKDMKVLLYKMMPPMVVKKLRRGETVVQRYDLGKHLGWISRTYCTRMHVLCQRSLYYLLTTALHTIFISALL